MNDFASNSTSRPTSAPLVSVVIPAYNQAGFLAGAIESVLNQTCRDFEVIVVDDGSTDETLEVARRYCAPRGGAPGGPQVRYLWQENQGLAGARNTGILASQAEFVALLDSDDEWLPGFLEEMLALAARQDAAAPPDASVYYCPVQYMDAQGRDLPQGTAPRRLATPELHRELLRANFLVPSTILMRRAAVLAAGLFDPAFRRLQDWELWLRMLAAGHRFAEVPRRLVRYRLHGSSLSTDPAGGQAAAMAMAVKLFGPEEGHPAAWPPDKRRAFGGVYRYHALSSLLYREDWPACARHLRRGLLVDPSLAQDAGLFYELALGGQPIGYRGTGHGLDLEKNAARLAGMLEAVFNPPLAPGLAGLRRPAWAATYRALGLLAYNLGQHSLGRRYLLAALRTQPGLVRDRLAMAALVKSWLGRAAVDRLRRLKHSL